MHRAPRAAALLLVLLTACARRSVAVPDPGAGGEVRVQARGTVTALALAAGILSFCDGAGLHAVSLPAGGAHGAPGPCPAGGLPAGPAGPEVTVRNPDHGPDDIVEIEGVAASFPLPGRARDWASSGDAPVVIVATASQVLRIDTAANRQTPLSSAGAERVATGGGWAAWVSGTTIVARPL